MFVIDIDKEYAFCQEFWSYIGKYGKMGFTKGVNNSISVFTQGNTFLDFYIEACKTIILEHPGQPSFMEVGTKFLSALYLVLPFTLI